jgi:hypothetical protein
MVLSSALVFHNRSLTPQALPAEDRLSLQGANMLSQGALAFLDDVEMSEPEADADTVDGESNGEAVKDQIPLIKENEVDSPTPPSGETTLSRNEQDRDKLLQAQPIEPAVPVAPPVPKESINPPAQEPAEPMKPEAELQPSPSVPEESTPPVAEDSDLNPYVLDVIKTYTNGPYPYLLNTDYANYNGVTENIFYQSRTLAKAHPSGSKASHCSGITFEVFHKAMQARNRKLGLSPDDFNGMTFNDLHDFLLIWYVANGPKSTNNIAVAMEKYGVGRRITNFEDARPGDFLDFSRTNDTGHTVVFLNWVSNGNSIVGLRYWSSQGSTNGIAEKTEYFTTGGGNLRTDNVYIGRVLPVRHYRSFR